MSAIGIFIFLVGVGVVAYWQGRIHGVREGREELHAEVRASVWAYMRKSLQDEKLLPTRAHEVRQTCLALLSLIRPD